MLDRGLDILPYRRGPEAPITVRNESNTISRSRKVDDIPQLIPSFTPFVIQSMAGVASMRQRMPFMEK